MVPTWGDVTSVMNSGKLDNLDVPYTINNVSLAV
jgi:hypothetical protein